MPGKSRYIELAEKIFTIISLIFYSDAVTLLLSREIAGIEFLSRIGYYLIPFITICLIIYHWRKIHNILFGEKLILIFVGFILISVVWSVLPNRTLRMDYSVVRTTLFGLYFASRYSLKEQYRLLLIFLGIIAFLNLFFVFFMPNFGIMGQGNIDLRNPEDQAHTGAWQGAFTHKNVLGRISCLSGILLLNTKPSGSNYILKWIGISSSVILIIFSKSSTSLVIFATLIALLPLFGIVRWKYSRSLTFAICFIITASILGIFILENSTLLFSLLGKDATLTGRIEIWDLAIWSILQRPMLGYGFGAFWVYGSGVEVIWKALGFEPTHSHNGFLDLLLNLGIIGTVLFFACYINAIIKSIKFLRIFNSNEGLYPIIFMTFLFLTNLTESSILFMNHYWIIFSSIVFSFHRKDIIPLISKSDYSRQAIKSV